jgi:hypothetical protein
MPKNIKNKIKILSMNHATILQYSKARVLSGEFFLSFLKIYMANFFDNVFLKILYTGRNGFFFFFFLSPEILPKKKKNIAPILDIYKYRIL